MSDFFFFALRLIGVLPIIWDASSHPLRFWAHDQLKLFKPPLYDALIRPNLFFYVFLLHHTCNVRVTFIYLLVHSTNFFPLPAQGFVCSMRGFSSQSHNPLTLLVTSRNSPFYLDVTICLILALRILISRYSFISHAHNLPALTASFASTSSQIYYSYRRATLRHIWHRCHYNLFSCRFYRQICRSFSWNQRTPTTTDVCPHLFFLRG